MCCWVRDLPQTSVSEEIYLGMVLHINSPNFDSERLFVTLISRDGNFIFFKTI